LVIQEMVKGLGSAGGHGMIAGGQVREIADDDRSQQQIEQLLTRRMLQKLELPVCAGEPLIDESD
jgi:hypothetical protein